MAKIVKLQIIHSDSDITKISFSNSKNLNAEEKTVLYLLTKFNGKVDLFKILAYRLQSKTFINKSLKEV